ncbi:alpha-N-acetylglucosaminidase [Mucilaginibacter kameinonensis]|uniref:alpha-N-acetylglucosaminidase n=1 Tax=Mucilaginibacter kameinonensis TaxID=452286 RepID=UPI000EF827D0|nr:alpha-N-acetylglucosaminidase [Mucilaginibacter kameinonensis]
MRKLTYLLVLLLPLQLFAQQFDPVKALVKRRAPWLSDHVIFKPLKSNSPGVFELQTINNKLVISASGSNAAAVGVNWYLKYYCHRSMSHMGDNLTPVLPLPVVNKKTTIEAAAVYRYALNYCTYNYTMSFYTWADWEREIDWMALNGVNTMLAVEGMEAVWQNTLRKVGYNEKEINDFIVGPAYTAWWLMGNIEGWGGPMPQSQIDNRKLIQQKMMKRMRELGIEPVLQGFYGMVPSSLKSKSKAHIIDQLTWGAFKRPDILDPTDPEFSRMAEIYYTEMQALYGKNIRFFAGDPFHEGGKTDGVDLKKAGAAIQASMQKYYPGSTWVLQGWQDNPKQAMLDGLDKSKILVQELFGEFTNNWKKRKAYDGSPFIWCSVNNFGERPGLYGKLQRFADEVDSARNSDYSKYLKGVGIMPEGINNNPPDYDLMLELGWRKAHVDTKNWINDYAEYRYGKQNEHTSNAWQGFLQTVYHSRPGYQEGAGESIFCARPALKVKSISSWGTLTRDYDTVQFEKAVKEFAKALPVLGSSATYKIDLINMVRQVLANKGTLIFNNVVTAYNNKDLQAFNEKSTKFLSMIKLTDELLNTDKYFRLNTYLKQAINSGNTPEEKANNLKNILMQITYWGENNRAEDNLHEYAYKEWAGLIDNYYLPRWEIYFNYLRGNLQGQNNPEPDFFTWEHKWVDENQKLITEKPQRALQEVVNEILAM